MNKWTEKEVKTLYIVISVLPDATWEARTELFNAISPELIYRTQDSIIEKWKDLNKPKARKRQRRRKKCSPKDPHGGTSGVPKAGEGISNTKNSSVRSSTSPTPVRS
jgi:hypothetical protein